MTAYRFVTLTCDTCGEVFDGGTDRTTADARAHARAEGWTQPARGQDQCGPCSSAAQPKPWHKSVHAGEVRGVAESMGWGCTPCRNFPGYDLWGDGGNKVFTVTFNSRHQFHSAEGVGGYIKADYRSHAYTATPRELLDTFKKYVDQEFGPAGE